MKHNQPLPETYTEILTYLRDHESGLTTRKIFDLAKKKRFFQLDNTNKISYITNALRSKKMITTSDAAGGKIHRITEAGLEAIADEAPAQDKTEEPEPEAVLKAADEIIGGIQDEETDQTDATSDIIAKFDDTFGAIRSFLIEYLTEAQPPVKIRNKTVKLSVLQRLQPMCNEEISQVLGEIRLDLEQLEAE